MEHEVAAGQPAQKKQRRSQNKGGLPYTLHKDGSNDPYECNCCHTRFTTAMMRKHVKATASFASSNPSATPLAACQHALSINKDERGKKRGQKASGVTSATAAATGATQDEEGADDDPWGPMQEDDEEDEEDEPQDPQAPPALLFPLVDEEEEEEEEHPDAIVADPFLAAVLRENDEDEEREGEEQDHEEEEDIPTMINEICYTRHAQLLQPCWNLECHLVSFES